MIWMELTAALENQGNLGCDKGAICTTDNKKSEEQL